MLGLQSGLLLPYGLGQAGASRKDAGERQEWTIQNTDGPTATRKATSGLRKNPCAGRIRAVGRQLQLDQGQVWEAVTLGQRQFWTFSQGPERLFRQLLKCENGHPCS